MQIRARCLALQDLAITVKRTKSDARECEIYRGFVKMKSLQTLFLTLDCSDWRVCRGDASPDDSSFDEDDRELYFDQPFDEDTRKIRFIEETRLKRGHVRETFVNCAVDETLARSIWKTNSRNKMGKQLESLKIYTTGGGKFGERLHYHKEIADVVQNLSRSWLIERLVRDDEVDAFNVKELGREAREARDERTLEFPGMIFDNLPHPPGHSALPIFRRIWAPKEGSKDWRDDWASFPLHC